jgi:tetratricopeptide (TPR) repeat protein
MRSADSAVAAYYFDDYAQAEALLEPLAKQTDENFVLNNARLGSVALAKHDYDIAEDAFLRAYEVINSVGVNNGGRTLGATVISENIKVWKGEPFERAMVNFYLGLIYYTRHDYNNARACFENALFKLRDYGEGADAADSYRQQESSFALGYLMLGKSYQRLGRNDDAQKAFARATALQPYLGDVSDFQRNQQSNVLLVVDYGRGPLKGTNRDGDVVGFVPTAWEEGPIPPPAVYVDGRPINLQGADRPPVDLLALAQDRKWQSIDTIRAVKSGLGTGLIAGGIGYGVLDRHANPYVALGLIAGGLALKATSHADVRQWEMLPRTTFILPISLPPGKHNVMVDFPNVPGMHQEWRGLEAPAQGEATYYFRMLRYSNAPYSG